MKTRGVIATKENAPQLLFAIVQTKIEKLPYAEENDEYMPDFLRVYSENVAIDYNESTDLTFDSWDELVTRVYDSKRLSPPMPVRSFSELLGKEAEYPDGGSLLIDSVERYLYCYGLESSNLYWIRKVPTYAAFFPSSEEAENFLADHKNQLCEPRIKSIQMGILLE